MALDHDRQNEILLTLQELKFQVGRLVSDAESEKEFRKKRNEEVERRLRDLETWKAEMHGRLVVTVAIGGVLIPAVIALVIKFI